MSSFLVFIGYVFIIWLVFSRARRGKGAVTTLHARVKTAEARLREEYFRRPMTPTGNPLSLVRRLIETLLRDRIILFALVGKELRLLLRSRKAGLVLLALSGVASLAFLVFWLTLTPEVSLARRSAFSRQAFDLVFRLEFIGLGLIAAVTGATSISIERERRTLDLLLTIGIDRVHVILAKWFAAIAYLLLLEIALMPVGALTFQLGGVGTGEYLLAALLVAAGVATAAMVGIAASCHLHRSLIAILAAVAAVTALGLVVPTWRAFEDGRVFALGHFVLDALIMAGAFAVALGGLVLRETFRVAPKKFVIKDEALLRMRREEWPYYLIDPLAQARPIGDDQNPVLVKELRVNPLVRMETVIRIGYVVMGVAAVATLSQSLRTGDTEIMRTAQAVFAVIALSIPALAATALSKEREEQTLALLRASPLAPWTIVGAKFRVAARALLFFSVVWIFPVLALYFGMAFGGNYSNFAPGEAAVRVLLAVPPLAGWSLLYAAAALICSALARRNTTALAASVGVIVLLAGFPWSVEFAAEIMSTIGLGPPELHRAFLLVRAWLGPVLSPLDYAATLARGVGEGATPLAAGPAALPPHFYSLYSAAASAVLAWALLWFSGKLMARALRNEN